MKAEQVQLNVPQDEYADLVGWSPRTLTRFRQGSGKLSRRMRQTLLYRHPKWKPTVDRVVLEDLHQDDASAATG